MKSNRNFEIEIHMLQSVLPDDPASSLRSDVAISFADFPYRTFPSLRAAQEALAKNVFLDQFTDTKFVHSENSLLSKRFVGERVVGVFLSQSVIPYKVINVRLTLTLTKQPVGSNSRAEVVLNKEVDLQSLSPQETVAIPFLLALEAFNYE